MDSVRVGKAVFVKVNFASLGLSPGPFPILVLHSPMFGHIVSYTGAIKTKCDNHDFSVLPWSGLCVAGLWHLQHHSFHPWH